MHVLIAGCGITGLTVAQGCRQHGIPYTIFERDPSPDSRTQGWSLTLHFGLEPLERMIGPDLAKLIPKVSMKSGPLSLRLTVVQTVIGKHWIWYVLVQVSLLTKCLQILALTKQLATFYILTVGLAKFVIAFHQPKDYNRLTGSSYVTSYYLT